MIKSNYGDFLSKLLLKVDSQKSEQSKEGNSKKQQDTLDFSTKNPAPTDDWGGMVSFSKTAEPSAPSTNNTLQESVIHSNGYNDFLKSLLSQPTTASAEPEAPTVPTTPDELAIAPTPVIPEGEKGSVEWAARLLGNDLSNYHVAETDSQGRATKLAYTYPEGMAGLETEYTISYNDENGETKIQEMQFMPGAVGITSTFNSNGEKIREEFSNGFTVGPQNGYSMVKEFSSGNVVKETKTWDDASFHDGVKTEITTYNADGSTTVKKFDANGQEIKDTPVIQEGEIGSKEYISKILGFDIEKQEEYLPGWEITKDDLGRIVSVEDKYSVLHTKYEISYNDDNTETTVSILDSMVGGTHDVNTYNAQGELVRKVLGQTGLPRHGESTTIYYENGEEVKRVKRTENSDGTISERTDKPNGSWSNIVKDENGNVISAEGKEILKSNSGTIFSDEGITPDGKFTDNPLSHGRGVELFNGMSIINKGNDDTEVTYSMDANGEITINGSNLEINAYSYEYLPEKVTMPGWVKSSDVQFNSLVVNGDNNVVNGSKYDDNVKVIGNNNQIDLGDGIDTVNIIGDNNSVKNTENITEDKKVIPAGEKGSVEYLNELNKNWNINPDEYSATFDEQGRVTHLSPTSMKKIGGTEYSISYDDEKGEVTVTPNILGLADAPTHSYTYSNEKMLVRERITGGYTRYPSERIIEHSKDGSRTETTEYQNPLPSGISKEVTKYDSTGSYNGYGYDADGNKLKWKHGRQYADGSGYENVQTFKAGSNTRATETMTGHDANGNTTFSYTNESENKMPCVSTYDAKSLTIIFSGSKKLTLSDGDSLVVNADGTSDVTKADGTVIKYDKYGNENITALDLFKILSNFNLNMTAADLLKKADSGSDASGGRTGKDNNYLISKNDLKAAFDKYSANSLEGRLVRLFYDGKNTTKLFDKIAYIGHAWGTKSNDFIDFGEIVDGLGFGRNNVGEATVTYESLLAKLNEL